MLRRRVAEERTSSGQGFHNHLRDVIGLQAVLTAR
jgi:hypothetical protein